MLVFAAIVTGMTWTPKAELPVCPRHDNEGASVSKDGTYGKRSRQRFRCTNSTTGVFHRFTPPLPKTSVALGVCDTCENAIQTHQGPAGLTGGFYELREVVAALQAVATGTSYTEAARAARVEYWGAAGTGRRDNETVESGQTVADWMERYAPAIISSYPAASQVPAETVVLDSTWFQNTNTWTGVSQDLFCVLGAYGYTGGGAGQVLGFWPSPNRKQPEWEKFLATLPKPLSVVADGDKAIAAAVRKVWPGVPLHRCEHHLYVTATDRLPGRSNPHRDALGEALAGAFQSMNGWVEFKKQVRLANHKRLVDWVQKNDKMVTTQLVNRPQLPPHYGNSSIETKLRLVVDRIQSRAWTFRNRDRLCLLLSLMRLQMNQQYNAAHWLRTPTESELTHPQPNWTRNTDQRGIYSLRR